MKEIAQKVQSTIPGSWETHLTFTKVCAGGRHEITHVFAKILFPLWDKSWCILHKIHRANFFKIFMEYLPRPNVPWEKYWRNFITCNLWEIMFSENTAKKHHFFTIVIFLAMHVTNVCETLYNKRSSRVLYKHKKSKNLLDRFWDPGTYF